MKNANQLLGWGLLLLMFLSSCTIGRMVVYNFSDIKDYKKFPSRPLSAAEEPFQFPVSNPDVFARRNLRLQHDAHWYNLDSLLTNSNSVAFLVIHQDSIRYERYLNKYDESSPVASFSMAKSYVSALMGIAIAEGHVKSVEDKVVDYIPELSENGWDEVKVLHVLQMTTGVKHKENYFNPFAGVAKSYYGRNLHKQVNRLPQEFEGGHYFRYKSINTQILGEIIVRATGRTLTDYFEEKLWGPMQMEYPASWSIDQKKNGMEKAFCCINATARDFAKFGRLYLHNGNWDGRQLVPEEWVHESTKIDATEGSWKWYQYQWWLMSEEGDYCAQGHLGQFIYIHPKKDLVVVRLGKNSGGLDWMNVFRQIAAQYE